MPEAELTALRVELLALLNVGKSVGRIIMDPAARDLWGEVYAELTQDHHGLAGCVVNRGEAQVIRLAMLYALLDKQQVIGERRLISALAFWKYCHESAMVIFGQREANPVAAKVLKALQGGAQLLTDLHRAMGNNVLTHRLKATLEELNQSGRVQCSKEHTPGRTKTVFKLNERNEFNELSPPAVAVLPSGNPLALAV
ncbi:MAG: hypothetical protein Q8O35_09785 [Humidesulfovibrio sp.]|jgi:hypothetical protein|uniref:hypothetical protein n=1 Tax=Humidesulfovibrio sp. TaxID=2910988 RepID=UPI0027370A6A|nr:hypothetical protein [Humidesulfovibrio sp.]MDP2848471.1 hypothetical protein [Humidesulfovibrio sp.]